MASALFVLLISALVVSLLTQQYKNQLKHPPKVFGYLFLYHTFFFVVYYSYAMTTASDSITYYTNALSHARGPTWFDFYGISTVFIEFLAYPFIHGLGFSYEAMMLLFSLFGFLGFFYFYLFIAGLIQYQHKFYKIDFILLLLFLPNMHFWTVSLGKGSVIFMGLGLFFYGLSRVQSRWLPLMLGVILIYHIRVHILMIILIAIVGSLFTSSKGLKGWQKALLLVISVAALSPALSSFLEMAQIEELTEDSATGFLEKRGGDLSRATSGIDINNYNQIEKLFAFLFRPLFFDAPNVMGIFVSIENLFYILVALKVASLSFFRFLWNSDWIVKVAFLFFIGASLVLAQISGNLGLAIRQKSQVMYLFLFVVLAYADYAYRTRGKLVIGE